VVTQTLKTNSASEGLADAIEGRVAAIARAHSTLTEHGGRATVSLHGLVVTELEPYRGGHDISVEGVDITLKPGPGLSLSMAIHELTSNAAKYGALSTPAGRLAVSWTVGGASRDMLSFRWLETGGPPMAGPPAQRGFGTTLIERTLTHELDATVNREFLSSGLLCTIELPLTAEIGEEV
jgi:two-component system CheB/CheR fusion protein